MKIQFYWPPPPPPPLLGGCSYHIHFLRLFAACFSARAFGGWLFCLEGPAGAHGARPYSALRTPPKAYHLFFGFLRGGVGQNGAQDAQFSATTSFHVASRAFCGWLFCPQCPADAHDARLYSCLRYPPNNLTSALWILESGCWAKRCS